MRKTTFAVIVGNRGFFPDVLAKQGRQNILKVLKENGFGSVALSMRDTKYGAVETFDDAKKCAALFADKAEKIDGIIVTLPNFGDEKGVAETIKRCGLDVPVLVHAEPDIPAKMTLANRADSFCGKISVCNNLRQAGITYTLTDSHTVKVTSADFKRELDDFASVCRIITGLRSVRFGQIGARTGAFNTVRYSEKILALAGIAVETIDLSEIFGRVGRLADSDRAVKNKLNSLKQYLVAEAIPVSSLVKMAKLGLVIDRWSKQMNLDGTAIQCWTSIEEFYGVVPCSLMSMMSESLVPSACETDITGTLSMYILQLAGGTPSALLNWNNNYGSEKDKCVLFHCSNAPKSFLKTSKMSCQDILAGAVGIDNSYGTVTGRIKPGNATFCRATTDDNAGILSAYVGQGQFTNDKLDTFGGYGVLKVPNMQDLLQYICRMGFEHHVAVNMSQKADAITEALGNYLGWELYRHE